MYYYCKDCKAKYDEDEVNVYEEPSEAWGHIVYEEFLLCPKCGESVSEDLPCFSCKNYEYCIDGDILCDLGEDL